MVAKLHPILISADFNIALLIVLIVLRLTQMIKYKYVKCLNRIK